jgi:hypothetical protein
MAAFAVRRPSVRPVCALGSRAGRLLDANDAAVALSASPVIPTAPEGQR